MNSLHNEIKSILDSAASILNEVKHSFNMCELFIDSNKKIIAVDDIGLSSIEDAQGDYALLTNHLRETEIVTLDMDPNYSLEELSAWGYKEVEDKKVSA